MCANMIYINIFNGKQIIIYCWQIVEMKLFCLYKQKISHIYIYPFESHRRLFSTFDQNFDFKIRWDMASLSYLKLVMDGSIKKFSYERRAYESVDVRSLFWVISHRSKESSTLGVKGLYIVLPYLIKTLNT